MVSRDKLLAVMETRYDYYSARAVLADALGRSGLADKGALDAADVRKLAATVGGLAPKTETLVAALTALVADTPAPVAAPVEAPTPVEEAPVLEAATDEAPAEEAVADAPADEEAEKPKKKKK